MSWPVAIFFVGLGLLFVAGAIELVLLVLLAIREVWRRLHPPAEEPPLPVARVVTNLQSLLTVSAERGKPRGWISHPIRTSS
jgi:hypothetical protein